jgi:micrococcal nuclease
VYEYQAIIRKVVDGDTFDVELDLGLEVRHRTRLRLAEINAPELSTPAGQELKLRLEMMFADDPVVLVQTIKDRKEKWGRYLGKVMLPDGTYLNEWLVQQGLADRA